MKSAEAWQVLRERRVDWTVRQFAPGRRQGDADVVVIGEGQDGTWYTGMTDERGMLEDSGRRRFPTEDEAWADIVEWAPQLDRQHGLARSTARIGSAVDP